MAVAAGGISVVEISAVFVVVVVVISAEEYIIEVEMSAVIAGGISAYH